MAITITKKDGQEYVSETSGLSKVEERWHFEAQVYSGDLEPHRVRVELYADPLDDTEPPTRMVMSQGEAIPGAVNGYVYLADCPATRPGQPLYAEDYPVPSGCVDPTGGTAYRMETVNDRSPASAEREIAAQVAYEVAKSLYFEEQLKQLRRPSSAEVMTVTQKTIQSAPVYDPYKGSHLSI